MNLTVNIAEIDKSTLINWESLNLSDVINAGANTIAFEISIHAGQTYRPKELDEVEILDGSVKLFSGKIISISDSVAGKLTTQTITVKDWTSETDRITVNDHLSNMTVDAIFAYFAATYLPGTDVTISNVDCAVVIPSIYFKSISMSKAIQMMAEKLNYSWYIDYDKDIHFFAKNSEVSPFNLDATSGNFVWDSLEITINTTQLRNSVLVEGGNMTSSTTKTKYHTGDGTQKTFNTDYQFASKPVVTVGGVTKTVGIDNLDNDADYNCLWNFEQKYIRFVSASASAAAIQLVGYPLIPIMVLVEDLASIAKYKKYEYKITDNTIATEAEALQYAQAQIDAYGMPFKEARFVTYQSGIKSGQTISVNLADRDINETFIVQRVAMTLLSQTEGEYTVELATLRSIGIVDFLQKMISEQNKNAKVSDTEVLKKYTQLNETIEVTEEINLVDPIYRDDVTVSVTEEIVKDPLGAGVMPDFVLAPYMPTSNTDPKREFCLDTCPLG